MSPVSPESKGTLRLGAFVNALSYFSHMLPLQSTVCKMNETGDIQAEDIHKCTSLSPETVDSCKHPSLI